jgi:hypothetical protein
VPDDLVMPSKAHVTMAMTAHAEVNARAYSTSVRLFKDVMTEEVYTINKHIGPRGKRADAGAYQKHHTNDTLFFRSGSEEMRMAYCCDEHPVTCPFRAVWQWDKAGRKNWLLTEYCEHTCAVVPEVQRTRRCAVHAYTSQQLSPLLLPVLRHQKKLKIAAIRDILAPYLRLVPSDAFCAEVRKHVHQVLGKRSEADISFLPNYLQMLEEQGHHTLLLKQTSKDEATKLTAAAKRRHEESHDDRQPFDAAKDKELRASLAKLKASGTYYYAWLVVFKWASPFLEAMHPAIRTIGMDAGHCTGLRFEGDEGGVMVAIDALTTNRQRLMLMRGHFCANESFAVWYISLDFASTHLRIFREPPGAGETPPTAHRDGKAEISRALEECAKGLKPLLCVMHGASAAMKARGLGSTAAETQKKYRDHLHIRCAFGRSTVCARHSHLRTEHTLRATHAAPEGRWLSKFVADGGRVQACLNSNNQQDI